MKKKAVIALLATVLVFGATTQAEDSYDDGGILDPENPVTLTVWHYYNGVHQAAFDKLVEEFNSTVGKDLGIYVEETSKGSVSDLGMVLRAKGMLPCTDGTWMHFDLVPGEYEIRTGAADYTGRLCVIGSKLKEDKLEELFLLK